VLTIEKLKKIKREENIKELRNNINLPWINTKITNYIERFSFLNLTEESIKEQILDNDIIASFFIKDPSKQNITETFFANYISNINGVLNFVNLPSVEKMFLINGAISNKRTNGIKSIDYTWEFNNEFFIASQKYTNGSGGSQDNQYNDVLTFLDNTTENCGFVSCVLVDGSYYTENKMNSLKKYESKNVIICSVFDLESRLNERKK